VSSGHQLAILADRHRRTDRVPSPAHTRAPGPSGGNCQVDGGFSSSAAIPSGCPPRVQLQLASRERRDPLHRGTRHETCDRQPKARASWSSGRNTRVYSGRSLQQHTKPLRGGHTGRRPGARRRRRGSKIVGWLRSLEGQHRPRGRQAAECGVRMQREPGQPRATKPRCVAQGEPVLRGPMSPRESPAAAAHGAREAKLASYCHPRHHDQRNRREQTEVAGAAHPPAARPVSRHE